MIVHGYTGCLDEEHECDSEDTLIYEWLPRDQFERVYCILCQEIDALISQSIDQPALLLSATTH